MAANGGTAKTRSAAPRGKVLKQVCCSGSSAGKVQHQRHDPKRSRTRGQRRRWGTKAHSGRCRWHLHVAPRSSRLAGRCREALVGGWRWTQIWPIACTGLWLGKGLSRYTWCVGRCGGLWREQSCTLARRCRPTSGPAGSPANTRRVARLGRRRLAVVAAKCGGCVGFREVPEQAGFVSGPDRPKSGGFSPHAQAGAAPPRAVIV